MAKKSKIKVYDLKITLGEVKPTVWRRLLVPDSLTLGDLHSLIQLSMGWSAAHLYDFNIGESRFTDPDEEFDQDARDAVKVTIGDALGETKKFTYTYDFGDNWTHEIEVMGLSEPSQNTFYPLCIGGENACPPEDCGGAPGYEDFLEAISDPKNESHEDMKSWVGGYFDPKGFDANLINRILRDPGD